MLNSPNSAYNARIMPKCPIMPTTFPRTRRVIAKMPKKLHVYPENGKNKLKRPDSRENAQHSRQYAGVLDLLIMPKVMPAYSAWP